MSSHSMSLPSIPDDDDGIYFSSESSSDDIAQPNGSSTAKATHTVAHATISSSSSSDDSDASVDSAPGVAKAKDLLQNKAKALHKEIHEFQELVAKSKDREGEILKSPAQAIAIMGVLMVVMVICVVVFGIFTGGVGAIGLIMPMMVAGGLMASFAFSKYQYDLSTKQLPYSNIEDELGKMKKSIIELNQLIDNPKVPISQKYQRYLELQDKIREATHSLADAVEFLENTKAAKHKQPVIDAITKSDDLVDAIEELDDAITSVTKPGKPKALAASLDDDSNSDVEDDAESTSDASDATVKKVNIDGAESDEGDGDDSPGSEESDD